MSTNPYPVEALFEEDDDGTIINNVEELRSHVVGRKIVSAEKRVVEMSNYYWNASSEAFVITLDDGHEVILHDTSDCCAYTSLEKFLLNPSAVDHVITGVGTTDGYTTWHIYADMGDMLTLEVGWSSGNPFYYGYGFDITVQEIPAPKEIEQ